MTSVDDWVTVGARLASADALLLDFDGPVCSVFSGFPAPVIAEQLRHALNRSRHCPLPGEIRNSSDPFDVLYYAATQGEVEARYVEAAFTAHECEAIQSAQPTPGAHELIHEWHDTGRPLVIVSNNSRIAIEAYLSLHNLARQVTAIAAREFIDPSRLKPSPYLVRQALEKVGVEPERAVFLGDSVGDIHAGHAAGVLCIAFANRPSKVPQLVTIADLTVTALPDVRDPRSPGP